MHRSRRRCTALRTCECVADGTYQAHSLDTLQLQRRAPSLLLVACAVSCRVPLVPDAAGARECQRKVAYSANKARVAGRVGRLHDDVVYVKRYFAVVAFNAIFGNGAGVERVVDDGAAHGTPLSNRAVTLRFAVAKLRMIVWKLHATELGRRFKVSQRQILDGKVDLLRAVSHASRDLRCEPARHGAVYVVMRYHRCKRVRSIHRVAIARRCDGRRNIVATEGQMRFREVYIDTHGAAAIRAEVELGPA